MTRVNALIAEYVEAGRIASEHLKKHGNVMSPERAVILRRLTETRVAMTAAMAAGLRAADKAASLRPATDAEIDATLARVLDE